MLIVDATLCIAATIWCALSAMEKGLPLEYCYWLPYQLYSCQLWGGHQKKEPPPHTCKLKPQKLKFQTIQIPNDLESLEINLSWIQITDK